MERFIMIWNSLNSAQIFEKALRMSTRLSVESHELQGSVFSKLRLEEVAVLPEQTRITSVQLRS